MTIFDPNERRRRPNTVQLFRINRRRIDYSACPLLKRPCQRRHDVKTGIRTSSCRLPWTIIGWFNTGLKTSWLATSQGDIALPAMVG